MGLYPTSANPASEIRLRYLRCQLRRTRPHARNRQKNQTGNGTGCRAAPDRHRCHARRIAPNRQRLLGQRHPPHRGVARRQARRLRQRTFLRVRFGQTAARGGGFRYFRGGLSRSAPRSQIGAGGFNQSETQNRRGCESCHHTVFL